MASILQNVVQLFSVGLVFFFIGAAIRLFLKPHVAYLLVEPQGKKHRVIVKNFERIGLRPLSLRISADGGVEMVRLFAGPYGRAVCRKEGAIFADLDGLPEEGTALLEIECSTVGSQPRLSVSKESRTQPRAFRDLARGGPRDRSRVFLALAGIALGFVAYLGVVLTLEVFLIPDTSTARSVASWDRFFGLIGVVSAIGCFFLSAPSPQKHLAVGYSTNLGDGLALGTSNAPEHMPEERDQ